jgi:hypothetical protein
MFNLNRVLFLGRGFFPVFVHVFPLGSSLIQGHYQKKGLCEPAALFLLDSSNRHAAADLALFFKA